MSNLILSSRNAHILDESSRTMINIRMGITRKDSKETHPCSISLALQATVTALCVKSSRHRLFGWKLWPPHLQSISSYHSLRRTVLASTGFIDLDAEDGDTGRDDMLGEIQTAMVLCPLLENSQVDGSSLPKVATSSS